MCVVERRGGVCGRKKVAKRGFKFLARVWWGERTHGPWNRLNIGALSKQRLETLQKRELRGTVADADREDVAKERREVDGRGKVVLYVSILLIITREKKNCFALLRP